MCCNSVLCLEVLVFFFDRHLLCVTWTKFFTWTVFCRIVMFPLLLDVLVGCWWDVGGILMSRFDGYLRRWTQSTSSSLFWFSTDGDVWRHTRSISYWKWSDSDMTERLDDLTTWRYSYRMTFVIWQTPKGRRRYTLSDVNSNDSVKTWYIHKSFEEDANRVLRKCVRDALESNVLDSYTKIRLWNWSSFAKAFWNNLFFEIINFQ